MQLVARSAHRTSHSPPQNYQCLALLPAKIYHINPISRYRAVAFVACALAISLYYDFYFLV